MKWQLLHALLLLGADECALQSQNPFPLALPRLGADQTLQFALPPSAAAKKHGWAHGESFEMEEEERALLLLRVEDEEENPPRNSGEDGENGAS